MRALQPAKPDTAGQLETIAQAISKGTYVDPVANVPGLIGGRVDQGKDEKTTSSSWGKPIDAVGAGVITAIDPNFYKGQPAIYETLTSGPLAGEETYYAEQLTPEVHVGQRVKAGQPIAAVASSGTGLELGWAKENQPAAHGEYTHDGIETAQGKNYSQFLTATKGLHLNLSAPGAKKTLEEDERGARIAEHGGADAETGGVSNPLGPSAIAAAVAKAVLGWLEEAFGALFVKALMYVVLAGGGAALIIAGFSRATGTHPVAAAKRAAIAGAAA